MFSFQKTEAKKLSPVIWWKKLSGPDYFYRWQIMEIGSKCEWRTNGIWITIHDDTILRLIIKIL